MDPKGLRASLLTTSSALAVLVGLGGPAWSQCAFNNDPGTGGTLTLTGNNGCVSYNAGATVTANVVNNGTITATGTYPPAYAGAATGISVLNSGTKLIGSITNGGTITGTASTPWGINVGRGQEVYPGSTGNAQGAGSTLTGSIINNGSILTGNSGSIAVGQALVEGGITNNGFISAAGGLVSVAQGTVLGSIVNNGTIINPTGADFFLGQGATIGGVTNAGTMTGAGFTAMAIVNGGTVVGSIVNSGRVVETNASTNIALWSGGQSVGGSIVNTNTGYLSGGFGLAVTGTAATGHQGTVMGNVSNAGTIVAHSLTGILLENFLNIRGSVINNGSITAAAGAGILAKVTTSTANALTIAGGITNSGTISGKTGIVVGSNVVLGGGIANSGILSGTRAAIDVSGASAAMTISQSAGTITGNILLSAHGDTLDITGGSLAGNVVGNSAVNGANAGTVDFNLGSGTFTTGGTFDVANIDINSGTVVLGADATVFGSLTNNATLQVNNTGLRTITGNYSQGGGGTFAVEISPSGSGELNVTKTATLAGTLQLLFDPGTYSNHTYILLEANSISGNFSQTTGTAPAGTTESVTVSPTEVQLGLTGSPTVAPTNSAVLTAGSSVIVENYQNILDMIFDQIDSHFYQTAGTPGTAGLTAPSFGTQTQLADLGGGSNIGTFQQIAEAMPQALGDNGGWFRGIGSFATVNGNSATPGFNAESGGFMAGLDREVAPNLYAGLAAGYSHTDMQQSSAASGGVATGRVMVYGGGLLASGVWSAALGYAHDSISTDRAITGIGTASENHAGNEVNGGAQWAMPLTVSGFGGGSATVAPKAGIMFLHLDEDGFSETGASGFDLSSNGNSTDSVQPFIGVTAAQTFTTDGGIQFTPELRLGYAHELANDDRVLNVATVSGASFLTQGVRPSRDMLTTGVGVTVRAQANVYLYANYDTVLHTGNTSEQTVAAGMRIRF